MRLIFSLVIVAAFAATAHAQQIISAYPYEAARRMALFYADQSDCHPSRARVIRERPPITRMPNVKLTTWQAAEKQLARKTLHDKMHAKAEQARIELGR